MATSRTCPVCSIGSVEYRRRYCTACRDRIARERKRRDDEAYSSKNREKKRLNAADWLARNRERNAVNCKARRDADLEAARQRDRERFARGAEVRRQKATEYYWKNRQKVLDRIRTPEARERARLASARRREASPYLRAYMSISRQIRQALAARKAGRRWEQIVGYSLDDLTRHIERQFRRGMSWANYGDWHIDHIRPRSLFDFSQGDDAVRDCWSLQNLQPLWAAENLSKSGKRTHLI